MGSGPNFFNYFSTPDVSADRTSLLQNADLTDWSMLLDYGIRQPFIAGDILLKAEEASRSLLIVLSGALRVTKRSTWGPADRTVAHVGPGSVVGELSFFDGLPRSTNVIADEAGEVFVLEWEAFERLAAVRPRVALSLLEDLGRIIAQRFRAQAASDD